MNPTQTEIGSSDRILIRTWTSEDIDPWLALSQDEGLNQFSITGYKMPNRETAQAFIEKSREIFSGTRAGGFPIVCKSSGTLIGICALKATKLDDETTEQYELMYRLKKEYWGQGYATETANLLLKYGFEKLQLEKIIGFIVPDNIRSRLVLLRIGMQYVRNSSIMGYKVEIYSKVRNITFDEFEKVNLRSGTIVKAESFPRAKKPAYKVWVDFGPDIGIKQTSAQITVHYTPETLVGRSVIGCVNLGTRNIGGFISEFLLVGFSDQMGAIRLATIDGEIVNGQKLH